MDLEPSFMFSAFSVCFCLIIPPRFAVKPFLLKLFPINDAKTRTTVSIETGPKQWCLSRAKIGHRQSLEQSVNEVRPRIAFRERDKRVACNDGTTSEKPSAAKDKGLS
ncbi:hypothetical protein DFJ73DRAFT_515374 [Zopfochytrium polystomum]|nr:hypothetical protein DFJ73DRAFT_515374 [Zopfochytrium polystomum]